MTDPIDDVSPKRLKAFLDGRLSQLTEEQVAECRLLAQVSPGLRLRTADDDPAAVELLWAGAVIGRTTWAWLSEDVA